MLGRRELRLGGRTVPVQAREHRRLGGREDTRVVHLAQPPVQLPDDGAHRSSQARRVVRYPGHMDRLDC
ncbi:hypothetical protein GCM10017786_29200 [Amycolatopsis deserti]|uniref:Uncharacterized protein n=1 Tax=Amycolatopsis deserti TaxID=185696 RepID=A0ABQ3IY10_9PSEU|nr:hypothetical protein GCM10017786_29200 [Amycolatopsis deserti]